MTHHVLKVAQPYFEALRDGTKTFEVRRNDRGYQRGDTLELVAYNGIYQDSTRPEPIRRVVTYVYAGDPRFGQWPPGVVVLGLKPLDGLRWTSTPPDGGPTGEAAEFGGTVPLSTKDGA